MRFRQLDLFIAVAEELHFGRAALRMGMAQPPFSQQIRRLEAELGVTLLTRTSRKVALTPAGLTLLDGARELLTRRAGLAEKVRRAERGETGTLRLGFGASSAFGILPGIIRRFREELPDVALQIDERDIDVGAALVTGELDLAIVRGPFRHPGAICETLLKEPFMLVVASTHPLALGGGRIELSALAAQRFVLFPRASGAGLHDTITGMCVKAGFSPDIVQEAASWSSVISLVEAGWGVTIAPVSARAFSPFGVTFLDLASAHGEAELVLARPMRPASLAALRFADLAQQAAKDFLF